MAPLVAVCSQRFSLSIDVFYKGVACLLLSAGQGDHTLARPLGLCLARQFEEDLLQTAFVGVDFGGVEIIACQQLIDLR